MWIVEGGELSGAAIQVDKTWTECWQETKAVINCSDTKLSSDFIVTMKIRKRFTEGLHNFRVVNKGIKYI